MKFHIDLPWYHICDSNHSSGKPFSRKRPNFYVIDLIKILIFCCFQLKLSFFEFDVSVSGCTHLVMFEVSYHNHFDVSKSRRKKSLSSSLICEIIFVIVHLFMIWIKLQFIQLQLRFSSLCFAYTIARQIYSHVIIFYPWRNLLKYCKPGIASWSDNRMRKHFNWLNAKKMCK